MRLVLLTKSALTAMLLLLGGASISCVKAAGLSLEVENPGSTAQGGGSLWGVPSSIESAQVHLPGIGAFVVLASPSLEPDGASVNDGAAGKLLLRDRLGAGDKSAGLLGYWASTGSFDGLITALVEGRFRVGLHAQAVGLTGQSVALANAAQPSAVPLSAAAWLFASALFGFIVVASRRKV